MSNPIQVSHPQPLLPHMRPDCLLQHVLTARGWGCSARLGARYALLLWPCLLEHALTAEAAREGSGPCLLQHSNAAHHWHGRHTDSCKRRLCKSASASPAGWLNMGPKAYSSGPDISFSMWVFLL